MPLGISHPTGYIANSVGIYIVESIVSLGSESTKVFDILEFGNLCIDKSHSIIRHFIDLAMA